jgi:outer membrane protein OmpA-like peptidoglycan-associated protein
MNTKVLLTIAGFGIACWAGLGWFRNSVVCKTCGATPAPNTNAIIPAVSTAADRLPYYFTGKNGTAIGFSDRFPAFKDSTVNALAADEKLVVKGYWYAGEVADAGIDDLGMFRAQRLKDTLSKFIDPSRISCVSIFMNEPNDANIYRGASVEKALQPKLSADSTTSVMTNGKLTVYFPTNSTKNIFDRETENNIMNIVNLVKAGKSLYITGHTDSKGNPDNNMILSEGRAEKLKTILVSRGANAAQIKTEGKGQTEPVSDNATIQGRALNRRAEVLIQ